MIRVEVLKRVRVMRNLEIFNTAQGVQSISLLLVNYIMREFYLFLSMYY
ncbi:MAG: hypothetical protein JETT_3787 [Candidatus Jettenia ecosi]|uniref:Uncharacterized protein n=1 Tax=Candidatus Jettenia ecosi TaxID=2494326 RepID=A0A533Q5X1_9BACT|nr:MAG: hypothetical protein JETT_3787 [Candidatus Jettenia ecosi]